MHSISRLSQLRSLGRLSTRLQRSPQVISTVASAERVGRAVWRSVYGPALAVALITSVPLLWPELGRKQESERELIFPACSSGVCRVGEGREASSLDSRLNLPRCSSGAYGMQSCSSFQMTHILCKKVTTLDNNF